MVVVIDEPTDLSFEVAGQIVVFEQDAVFERLMPTGPAPRRFTPFLSFVHKYTLSAAPGSPCTMRSASSFASCVNASIVYGGISRKTAILCPLVLAPHRLTVLDEYEASAGFEYA